MADKISEPSGRIDESKIDNSTISSERDPQYCDFESPDLEAHALESTRISQCSYDYHKYLSITKANKKARAWKPDCLKCTSPANRSVSVLRDIPEEFLSPICEGQKPGRVFQTLRELVEQEEEFSYRLPWGVSFTESPKPETSQPETSPPKPSSPEQSETADTPETFSIGDNLQSPVKATKNTRLKNSASKMSIMSLINKLNQQKSKVVRCSECGDSNHGKCEVSNRLAAVRKACDEKKFDKSLQRRNV
jgi:hypothetical protein